MSIHVVNNETAVGMAYSTAYYLFVALAAVASLVLIVSTVRQVAHEIESTTGVVNTTDQQISLHYGRTRQRVATAVYTTLLLASTSFASWVYVRRTYTHPLILVTVSLIPLFVLMTIYISKTESGVRLFLMACLPPESKVYLIMTACVLVPCCTRLAAHYTTMNSLSKYNYFGPMRILGSDVDGSWKVTFDGKLRVGFGMTWACPESATTWCETTVGIPECKIRPCQFGGSNYTDSECADECARAFARIAYFEDVAGWPGSGGYDRSLRPDEDPTWPYHDFYGDCTSCRALDTSTIEDKVDSAEKFKTVGEVFALACAVVYTVLLCRLAVRRYYRWKATQLVQKISSFMADDPWRDLTAIQGWNLGLPRDKQPQFHGLVGDLLSSLWKHPDGFSDERCQEVASECIRRFDLVRQSKIINADFLVDSDDPLDQTMREYCLVYSSNDNLLSAFSRKPDKTKRLLELLEEGRVVEVMNQLVHWSGDVVVLLMVKSVATDDEERWRLTKITAQILHRSKDDNIVGFLISCRVFFLYVLGVPLYVIFCLGLFAGALIMVLLLCFYYLCLRPILACLRGGREVAGVAAIDNNPWRAFGKNEKCVCMMALATTLYNIHARNGHGLRDVYGVCMEEFPALFEAVCSFLSCPSRVRDETWKRIMREELCNKRNCWGHLLRGEHEQITTHLNQVYARSQEHVG